ncbi:MAG: formylglycine-generating enzyme family protein [Planctomycetes bacterium]|nr:formylglycine-generating enzyme family protein [Planctomycetota bacterium]MCB9918284.1 formylglycine-generating enzyme family protein [Planctomycetota bacterium]
MSALFAVVPAQDESRPNPEAPKKTQDEAKAEKPFVAYRETIPGTGVAFDMVPIPAGKFVIGSPDDEDDRKASEGPQRHVALDAFWMGKCEITWQEYELWQLDLDRQRRKVLEKDALPCDTQADAVTRPTKPYADMTFGMGQDGYPAICMTQLAAKTYCQWLSAKTGHYYRLPTEAEWEYACRAGTTTRWSFGDDPEKLGDYAWYTDNSEDKYHKVGTKKPNPWGLYDMHGNVSEWCLDAFYVDSYGKRWPEGEVVRNPYVVPVTVFPRVARGGSWDDDADDLRSARRIASDEDWKMQDPQIPQSVWYHTDAQFLGFRIVRPVNVPTKEQQERFSVITEEERKNMRSMR